MDQRIPKFKEGDEVIFEISAEVLSVKVSEHSVDVRV